MEVNVEVRSQPSLCRACRHLLWGKGRGSPNPNLALVGLEAGLYAT